MFKYTIMMLLLIAALQAAGASYVIDKVCLGTQRQYRIDGETGSTYLWQLTNSAGNPVTLPNPSGTIFTTTDPITGQPKVGSEVIIQWNQAGTFMLTAIQYSSFGCDTLQQGEVMVYAQPAVYAGNPINICAGSTVPLNLATASNYSSLSWSSSGDGTFYNFSVLNPIYTVTPAPTGYILAQEYTLLEWLPSGIGLQACREVLRESLGLAVQRLMNV